MAGRVVYDSDDDSDVSPPSRSPAGTAINKNANPEQHQSRPVTPPRAMVALMEPSPLPVLPPLEPAAMHHTSSTDPSFFRTVYEEQQREIGAQLGAQLGTERDLWDVPSSPMQPPARPGSAGESKRKGDHSSSEPPKRQRQERQEKLESQERQQDAHPAMSRSSGMEISIPLGPVTPSMMHQYPQALSSSSLDQSYPGEVTHTLGRGLAAYNSNDDPQLQPPPAEPTQSTVAFPTPSMYASSGRRGLGSSNDPVVNDVHMVGAENKLAEAEPEVLPGPYTSTSASASTPPRKARAPLLMSSPDIIAGPAPAPLLLPLPPLPQPELRQAEARARDEIDDSSSELSFHSSPGRRELSPELPSEEPAVPEKPSPKKAKKIIIIKKPAVVIAASDDEDSESGGEDDLAGSGNNMRYQDMYAAPGSPRSDLDSDFSDSASKKKASKKGKKEKAPPRLKSKANTKAKAKPKKNAAVSEVPAMKSNEVILIELPGQAPLLDSLPLEPPPQRTKRTRGRPKQVAKTEYKDSEESDGMHNDLNEVEDVAGVSEAEAAVEPVAKLAKTAKATTSAKTKSRKGRGKRVVVEDDDDDDDELATPVPVLSETSGNAVPASIPDDKTAPEAEEKLPPPMPAAEEGKKEEEEETDKKKEKGKPASPAAKPAGSGLSTGLGGLGGRVLYRVGLSKKTRIAPLLKIVRK